MKKIILLIIILIFTALTLTGCFPSFDDLVGSWKDMSETNGEIYTFNKDGSFKAEGYKDADSTYYEYMNGTFSYDLSTNKIMLYVENLSLVFGDPMDSVDLPFTWTFEMENDKFIFGLDACFGGDTSTLLGNWEGSQTDITKQLHNWSFTSTTITHSYDYKQLDDTPITSGSATGSVTIDTANNTFTVSGSTDTGVIQDDTYKYIVIGDAISIADSPTENPTFYEKQ
jgi:hypothetical protein